MKKHFFALLATTMLGICQIQAGSIYGISADGDKDEFAIGDIRSIKIAPGQPGYKSYSTIKFGNGTQSSTSDEDASTRFIMVYPNPVSEYITISGVDENAKVSVVNMQGVEVIKTQGSKVDVSKLATGSYLLVVEGESVKFLKK